MPAIHRNKDLKKTSKNTPKMLTGARRIFNTDDNNATTTIDPKRDSIKSLARALLQTTGFSFGEDGSTRDRPIVVHSVETSVEEANVREREDFASFYTPSSSPLPKISTNAVKEMYSKVKSMRTPKYQVPPSYARRVRGPLNLSFTVEKSDPPFLPPTSSLPPLLAFPDTKIDRESMVAIEKSFEELHLSSSSFSSSVGVIDKEEKRSAENFDFFAESTLPRSLWSPYHFDEKLDRHDDEDYYRYDYFPQTPQYLRDSADEGKENEEILDESPEADTLVRRMLTDLAMEETIGPSMSPISHLGPDPSFSEDEEGEKEIEGYDGDSSSSSLEGGGSFREKDFFRSLSSSSSSSSTLRIFRDIWDRPENYADESEAKDEEKTVSADTSALISRKEEEEEEKNRCDILPDGDENFELPESHSNGKYDDLDRADLIRKLMCAKRKLKKLKNKADKIQKSSSSRSRRLERVASAAPTPFVPIVDSPSKRVEEENIVTSAAIAMMDLSSFSSLVDLKSPSPSMYFDFGNIEDRASGTIEKVCGGDGDDEDFAESSLFSLHQSGERWSDVPAAVSSHAAFPLPLLEIASFVNLHDGIPGFDSETSFLSFHGSSGFLSDGALSLF
jgi:hypothetical protein